MGIYDREYYRDATRGSGFLSGAAPACRMLILINVGMFLAQWVFRDATVGGAASGTCWPPTAARSSASSTSGSS